MQREQQQRTVVQQREPLNDLSTTTASASVPTSTTLATTPPSNLTPPSTSPSPTITAMVTTTFTSTSSNIQCTNNLNIISITSGVESETTTTSVITSNSGPILSTAASVVSASNVGGGDKAQPTSPKPADNATIDVKPGLSDLGAFEELRSQGGKFFGDDAKGDGSATAADVDHDGVVITVKEEIEPSVQEVVRYFFFI